MGLIDFVKDAGVKLFGGGARPQAGPAGQRDLKDVLADKDKAQALSRLVADMSVPVEGLRVKFREGRATVEGQVASQADREKLVLLLGNTQGVAQVEDRLSVARAEPEATFYTVKSGDTLSKISQAHYGDAMKYMTIFEANKPMLKDPDKIYPGQVLRIPPLAR